LFKGLRRQRGDPPLFALQFFQRPLQLGRGALLVVASGAALALAQVLLGILLVARSLAQRLNAGLSGLRGRLRPLLRTWLLRLSLRALAPLRAL
jgi:hypothetical protein